MATDLTSGFRYRCPTMGATSFIPSATVGAEANFTSRI